MESDPTELAPVVARRLSALPTGLQAHVHRARQAGRHLSELVGVDASRVDLALAAHDLFRAVAEKELLLEASRRGWDADPIELAEPLLLHGPVAGLWLMQEAGVNDTEVIDAVTWHTTYAPGLGLLPATVFLADKIDPEKVKRRPWLEGVRDLAYRGSVDEAVEMYLAQLIVEIVGKGGIAHSRALEALNSMRLARHATS